MGEGEERGRKRIRAGGKRRRRKTVWKLGSLSPFVPQPPFPPPPSGKKNGTEGPVVRAEKRGALLSLPRDAISGRSFHAVTPPAQPK